MSVMTEGDCHRPNDKGAAVCRVEGYDPCFFEEEQQSERPLYSLHYRSVWLPGQSHWPIRRSAGRSSHTRLNTTPRTARGTSATAQYGASRTTWIYSPNP